MRAALVVIAAVLAAYHNALGCRFALDDYHYVLQNPALSLHGVPALFTRAYVSGGASFYRPLSTATFAIDRALFGTWAAPFHAHNLLWHLACCLLLALILRRFLSPAAALAGALVFAVHPLHTEAVTGIVGRMELCATAFGLAGVALWLDGRRAPALLCALLALLGKESGLFCAPVAIGLDWLRGGDARASLRRGLWFALPLGAYALLRQHALRDALLPAPDPIFASMDQASALATAVDVLGRELRLLVYPHPLIADYGYASIAPSPSLVAPGPLAAIAMLAAWATAAVLLRRRLPALGVGLAIFVITILPLSNLVVRLNILMAERLLYAPSLAVAVVAAGAYGLVAARRIAPLVLGALVLCMAGLTLARNTDWETPLSLWQDTVEKQPRSALAHGNLALACVTVEDLGCAVRELRIAVAINPERADFKQALDEIERRSQTAPASR